MRGGAAGGVALPPGLRSRALQRWALLPASLPQLTRLTRLAWSAPLATSASWEVLASVASLRWLSVRVEERVAVANGSDSSDSEGSDSESSEGDVGGHGPLPEAISALRSLTRLDLSYAPTVMPPYEIHVRLALPRII